MKKSDSVVLVVALTLVLGFTTLASANTGALADFNAQYLVIHSVAVVYLPHKPTGRNPYGTALVNAGGRE